MIDAKKSTNRYQIFLKKFDTCPCFYVIPNFNIMIISNLKIKNTSSSRFFKSNLKKLGIIIFVLIGVITLVLILIKHETQKFPGKVFCNAETVKDGKYLNNGILFNGAKSQSKEWAFSGEYSAKVHRDNHFGMAYNLYNPKAGETYRARVWVRRPNGKDGFLVAASPDGKTFRIVCETPKRSHLAWDLFEIIVTVPEKYASNRIDFYVYTNEEVVYFDDFSIEKIKLKSNYNPEILKLNIADKWMKKLEKKRQAAMNLGILVAEDDDWVEGEIEIKDKKIPVTLRLKGDWLDHLRTDKWSYRIKVNGNASWKRMQTFSIQQPGARNYLNEWVFHQLLEKIDVLTPRYDFIEVHQNGQYKGIYAYEEHFEKQLVEFKKRREGPIVRFSEDVFWLNIHRELKMYPTENLIGRQFTDPREASQIQPFAEKKTVNSGTLAAQFDQAQKLLQQFRNNKKPIEEIFDIEMMAKYYAVIDLLSAYHSMYWTNSRYYYNPVTTKLEPIGYDGYSQGEDLKWPNATFIGEGIYNKKFTDPDIYLTTLFTNEKFIEKYTTYLYEYSSQAFFESFIESIEDEILARETLLQKDLPDYKFDFNKLYANVRDIRAVLEPYKNHSVQAFTESTSAKVNLLKVTNFHALPLRVIGFGRTEKNMSDTLEKKILLECNLKRNPPVFLKMKAPSEMKYVFFELPGKDSVYTTAIANWKAPIGETVMQQLFKQATITSTALYKIIGKSFIFNRGKHTVTKDIIIPQGYQVIFPAGLELDFVKKAKFISKSPVTMIGQEAAPIVLKSSDFSAGGFTVLQAPTISKMAYVTFDGFNTLLTNGWNLTGAVTFYESNVNISNCRFIKNRCEDGLNLVRCLFDMNDLTIGETFGDGLDIDFGYGTIQNAYFYKTGNDAMDFSGSNITVINAVVKDAGDKGVSVGEESNVYIKKIKIDGANIGTASKDLSKLSITFIDLKACNQGFVAFQKKPEYGPSAIVITDYKAEAIRFLHKIEVGSTLELKGKIIKSY